MSNGIYHRQNTLRFSRVWSVQQRTEGIDKLRISGKNKKYSKATKLSTVKEYLAGKGSLRTICTKHKIFDTKNCERG